MINYILSAFFAYTYKNLTCLGNIVMEETKAFNEKRAEIYWWLSSLFAKELTPEEIQAYHSQEIRSFLTGLGENKSLRTPIEKLIDALNRLKDRKDAHLELATDFFELFLKTGQTEALPCASAHIKTLSFNRPPAIEVAQLMQNKGIDIKEGFNEPTDHIAIELDFLGNMIIRSNELEKLDHINDALFEQKEFIEKYLLTWLPHFSQKCRKLDEFGFYSSVAHLLSNFCQLDRDYLAGE